MEQVALGWLVYELTGSPLQLSLVIGARSLPLLLFGPFGGVAADRFDRRRILLASQAIVMILAFIVAMLTITGRVQVWQLALISFLALAPLSGTSLQTLSRGQGPPAAWFQFFDVSVNVR